MKVRNDLPQRRDIPSRKPTGRNWSDHKPDLKIDFYEHCGYCGSFDGFRHTYFEVDHFVPKSLFEKTGIIDYCQYDNLVYSCKFCNNIKLSKWPSNDEKIANVNNEGFVDPCEPEYDKHLYRTNKGSIRWRTDLGKWMVEEGFKFDERDYSIKILWELRQLLNATNFLIEESKKHDAKSDKYNEIMVKVKDSALEYFLWHTELMEFYKVL